MSRYIERAENNARIADVNLQLLLDLANQPDADLKQQWNPIISSLEEHELFASLYGKPNERSAIDFVSLQKKNPNSIHAKLARLEIARSRIAFVDLGNALLGEHLISTAVELLALPNGCCELG